MSICKHCQCRHAYGDQEFCPSCLDQLRELENAQVNPANVKPDPRCASCGVLLNGQEIKVCARCASLTTPDGKPPVKSLLTKEEEVLNSIREAEAKSDANWKAKLAELKMASPQYNTEEDRLYAEAFNALNALSRLYSQTNKTKMYEVNKALHHLMDIQP